VVVTNELAPKPEDEGIDNAKLPLQNKAAIDSQNELSVNKQTIFIDTVIYNSTAQLGKTSLATNALSNAQLTTLDKSGNYLSPLIHIVQQGESLYSIVKIYQVSVDNLQLWNHLEDYMLLSDDRIMVSMPDASNFQQSQQPYRWLTHTVGKGENLTKIAKNYQTSVATLSQVNQLPDPNQIVFGQRLIVPVSLRYTATPLFKKGAK
jgi:LysM repeat protein